MIYGFFLKLAGTGVQLAGLMAGLALAVLTMTVIAPLIVGGAIFVFGSYLVYVGSHTVRVVPAGGAVRRFPGAGGGSFDRVPKPSQGVSGHCGGPVSPGEG